MSATYRGQVFVYPHYDSAADAPFINFVFPNQANPTYGYWARLVLAGNIHAIDSIVEGEMHPGYAAPYAPDVTSGTITNNIGTISAHSIAPADSTSYAEWTIPIRITANLDTAILFCSDTSSGPFDLIRNRGGTLTTIASAITPAGDSAAHPTTVSLSSSITGGDSLRWKKHDTTGNDIFLFSIQLYDSAASCTDSTQDWILVGQLTFNNLGFGSSMEQAVEIAPPGSSLGDLKFVGGAAHQGGSYGEEVSVTEQWSLNGTNITLGVGMTRGHVVLTRQSKLSFNDGINTDLASNTVTYEATDFGLKVAAVAVADVDEICIGERYVMLPVLGATASVDSADSAKPVTIAGLSSHVWSPNPKFLWIYGSPQTGTNAVIMAPFFGGSNGMSGAEIRNNSKHYVTQIPSVTPSIGNTLTTVALNASVMNDGAFYFGGADTGPAAPTVTSCSVQADGLTVTIVCNTKSGGMAGNTGFGLKRAGSSLTISSTTVNDDWSNGTSTYTVALDSGSKVFGGESITYSYTAGTATDAYGVALANIADTAAANNSTQTSGPTITASLDTTGGNLTLTFTGYTLPLTFSGGNTTVNTPLAANSLIVSHSAALTVQSASATISTNTIVCTLAVPLGLGQTIAIDGRNSQGLTDGNGTPIDLSSVIANLSVTNGSNLTASTPANFTLTPTSTPGIVVSWTGTNVNEDVKIYRGPDAGNLTLLHTVSTGALTYLDSTVTRGNTYVYEATAEFRSSSHVSAATSNLTVATQTLTSIVVSPANVKLANLATEQFTAVAYDQFGIAMVSQPSFTWTNSATGDINEDTGFYTADGNKDAVSANVGGVVGMARINYPAGASPAMSAMIMDLI